MGIEKDKLGNLVFRDFEGKKIKADPNKFKVYEPLCKTCKKDYVTCENEDAKISENDGGPIKTGEGYPDLLYCKYFLGNLEDYLLKTFLYFLSSFLL